MGVILRTLDDLLERCVPEPNTGCFYWLGGVSPNGYGKAWDGQTMASTHRLAFEFAHGPIPTGKVICHKCDVRSCCNPAHLFIGSQSENLADMRRKGRDNRPRGERHPAAKLTDAAVLEIRAATGGNEELAKRFGVTQRIITSIRSRRHWKHI